MPVLLNLSKLVDMLRMHVRPQKQIKQHPMFDLFLIAPSDWSKSSPIYSLPYEILQKIANHLPPSSAASLSLCSRTMLYIIGRQYWEACNSKPREKHILLSLLAEEMPNSVACHRCLKIHAYDRLFQSCYGADQIRGLEMVLHPKFPFVVLQIAMKLHRQGLDNSSIMAYICRPSIICKLQPGSIANQRLYEAKIVGRNLIFRSQHWFLYQVSPATGRIKCNSLPGSQICCHLQVSHGQAAERFTCRVSHGIDRGCVYCTGVNRCHYCDTEYEINCKVEIGEKMVAMVITKWMDMGEGLSPDDPKWERHFLADGAWSRYDLRVPRYFPDFLTGDIKSRFESDRTFIFDDSLTRDIMDKWKVVVEESTKQTVNFYKQRKI